MTGNQSISEFPYGPFPWQIDMSVNLYVADQGRLKIEATVMAHCMFSFLGIKYAMRRRYIEEE